MKKCTQCDEEKPLDAFAVRKGKPHSWCKPCAKAYGAAYRAKHREKARENSRQWRRDHPERSRESSAAYRRANPEKVRESQRKYRRAHQERLRERNRLWRENNRERHRENARMWAKNNPARCRERNARRRARLANAYVEDFTHEEIYYRDEGECRHCASLCAPDGWHLDHKIPIALGGHHSKSNVQLLCPDCNYRKGPRFDIRDWVPNLGTAFRC